MQVNTQIHYWKSMAIRLEIKVIPQSGGQKIVLDKNGQIKCYIKSAPEKGKANKEIISFLAKKLGISKQSITIVSGLTNRKKVIQIAMDKDKSGIMDALGLQEQLKLKGM